ncbi:MAG: hypothetical protein M0Z88_00980 [Actinomycetota bacterium]|nr:hypothetical protein [Actinomycetota bacterium]
MAIESAGDFPVTATVASSRQATRGTGLPLGPGVSRWSPPRTYQPPWGSAGLRPVRSQAAAEGGDAGGILAEEGVEALRHGGGHSSHAISSRRQRPSFLIACSGCGA